MTLQSLAPLHRSQHRATGRAFKGGCKICAASSDVVLVFPTVLYIGLLYATFTDSPARLRGVFAYCSPFRVKTYQGSCASGENSATIKENLGVVQGDAAGKDIVPSTASELALPPVLANHPRLLGYQPYLSWYDVLLWQSSLYSNSLLWKSI